MMLICDSRVATIECPACHAKAGVWCGGNRILGPMAHERRIQAKERLDAAATKRTTARGS